MKPRNNEPHYTSIIIASYIPDELRAKTFRTSLESLLETTRELPVEIIVIDNGGDIAITNWLNDLISAGLIQCLVRNAQNMHFGFGRNQGLANAGGNYICIADNDILYKEGWLEKCWEVLDEYPLRKFWATPIAYPDLPNGNTIHRYDAGELELNGETILLNGRAGSNCFVVRRKDFEEIGNFLNHRIAGSRWNDVAVRKGYVAAVIPGNYVSDMGLRVGYNHREALPVYRVLCNGKKIYFNQDEFKIPND